MRTAIYIDGFNLYYGRIKHSAYKWLDIVELFSAHIVRVQSPQAQVTKVKYFTADILARVASQGRVGYEAQQSYHRALKARYPDLVDIIKGYYSLEYNRLPRYQEPPVKADKVEVWRLEEKQTDVNLALHLYRDAARGNFDQAVIVSNDTDLAPALEMLRNDFGDRYQIGIVIPVAPNSSRPANAMLSKYADWTRRHILDEELALSQLPNRVPTRKKPIFKPEYW